MHRIQRAFVALSLMLGLVTFGAPMLAPHGADAASSTIHAGRLGGPESTFVKRFGEGSGSAKSGVTYHAAGFGAIVVKFDKDRAVDIVISAEPGASWASDQAIVAVRNILPKDANLDTTRHDTGDGRWELACISSDLGARFSKSDYKRLKHAGNAGECFALESPDSPGTIGSIELSIGRAGSLSRPVPTATPSPTPIPQPTPDTRTYVGQDGCTYMVATGAQVSCPAAPDNGTYVGADGCTYRNVDGAQIRCPSNDPTGATAQCVDGTYSYSQHASGTCSHHGGVARWINYPG